MASLSALIQRDFFPGLPRLSAENEYLAALEALDEGDDGAEHRLRQAELQLDRLDAQADTERRDKRSRHRYSTRAPSITPLRSYTPALDTPLRPLDRSWDATPVHRSRTSPDTGSNTDKSTAQQNASHHEMVDIADHTLSSFQNAYTSEDNASFLELLQLNNDRRRRAYAWAFDQERNHNTRRKFILDEAAKRADEGYARSLLALSGSQRRKLITDGRLGTQVSARLRELERLTSEQGPALLESSQGAESTRVNGNSVALQGVVRSISEEPEIGPKQDCTIIPRRARSTSPIALKPMKHSLDPQSEIALPPELPHSTGSHLRNRDDPDGVLQDAPIRPSAATAAGCKYSARNALFFGPDANIGTVDKATSSLPRASSSSASTTERLFHSGKSSKSRVNFHNTALPSQSLFPESKYGSGSSSSRRVKAGSSSSTSVRSSRIASALGGGSQYGDHFDLEGDDLRQGPMVNGYGFVTPHQSPFPDSEQGPGDRGGAVHPRRLKSGVKHAPAATSLAFAVPPTPRREEIAHLLASKQQYQKRDKHAKRPSALTPSQGKASRCTDMLSPAAQSLLSRSTRGGTMISRSTKQSAGAGPSQHKGSARSSMTPLGASLATSRLLGKRGWEDDETPVAGSSRHREQRRQ